MISITRFIVFLVGLLALGAVMFVGALWAARTPDRRKGGRP